MTDPNVRHIVCPECHTHQEAMPDGRVAEHTAPVNMQRCPGSEDWPNRATSTGGRSATNQFASCPAATGDDAGCTDFPDGAHRCAGERHHINTQPMIYWHGCTCGKVWVSLVGDTFDLAASRAAITVTARSAS